MNDLLKKFPRLYRHSWIKTCAPLAFIFLVSFIFFYPVWFQDKMPLPLDALVGAHVPWTELKWDEYPAGVPIKNQEITDAISQFYVWRSLAGEFWRTQTAPLWNPYMLSGTPFLATLHSAALSPLNFVYLFLSDANSWNAIVFSQIFLGGIFMYLFLNKLLSNKCAAVFGSIGFTFSGYMIGWLEFATGGLAGIFLPLLLYLLLNLKKTGNFLTVILISIAFFFVYTAGDFQVPLYVTGTYFLFFLYLSRYKSGKKRNKHFEIYSLIGLFSGVLLSLPQLLPTIELFSQSIRTDDPYIVEYFYGLMHWEKLANFLWPDFFGNVVTRNYWGKFGYHEYLAFTGITTIAFVIFAAFSKRLRYELFFWGLLVISLLFVFPTPLGFLPFKLKIPGLGTSSASRLLFLIEFCIATLGAYGIKKFYKELNTKRLFASAGALLLVTFAVASGLGFSVIYMKQFGEGLSIAMATNLSVSLKNMIPATAVLIMICLVAVITYFVYPVLKLRLVFVKFITLSFIVSLLTVEMLYFAWKNTPFSPSEFLFPNTEIITYLKNTDGRIAGGIPLNYFMAYDIRSAEGYDPIYPERNGAWFSAVNHGKLGYTQSRYGLIQNFASPLINYANIRHIIDYKKDRYGGISDSGNFYPGNTPDRYTQVLEEGRIAVFENIHVFPYVWLTQKYSYKQQGDDIVNELLNLGINEERVAVLEVNPEITFNDSADGEVTDISKGLNNISFNVTTEEDSILVLSETPVAGWNAYIDGSITKVIPANLINQAIIVPKGEHFIEFIYRPFSYTIGLTISAVVTVLLLVLLAASKKRLKTL